jgi:hypothetical protein
MTAGRGRGGGNQQVDRNRDKFIELLANCCISAAATSTSNMHLDDNNSNRDMLVPHPTPHDVVLLRSETTSGAPTRPALHHVGTQHWRILIWANRHIFRSLEADLHKQLLVDSVIEAVRTRDPPGRFLIQEDLLVSGSEQPCWYDAGDEVAQLATLLTFYNQNEDDEDEPW